MTEGRETKLEDRRRQVQDLSDAIESAERALNSARSAFLHDMGWGRTCNTPGSYWLWQRDFADVDARWREIEANREREGKPFPTPHRPIGTVIVDEEHAIIMSRASLDLLYGEHPDYAND